MKKLSWVLSFLVFLAFSCSKDALLNNDQNPDQSLSNIYPISSGSIIKVFPNGRDDSQTLIDAFAKAKASGINCVVKLMPGIFKIGLIEVKEFKGTLMGSGKGSTLITNLPGLSCDVLIQQNKVPGLITFIGGDVVVSNLSIKLADGPFWGTEQELNLLLFSDYSVDFMPVSQHIRVNLTNIEIVGGFKEGGLPYDNLNGIKFGPDMWAPVGNILLTRSNIDAIVTNSKFSKLVRGVFVWGCKSGKFRIGTEGGNTFTENNQGFVVNECLNINVKCMNNVFTLPNIYPSNYWDGIDINDMETGWLEYVPMGELAFEIRHNTFNIYYNGTGIGALDEWRIHYPDDHEWLKMVCDQNIFYDNENGAKPMYTYNMKGMVFSNNKIAGNGLYGYIFNWGIPWMDPIIYPLSVSEDCKYINNNILQKDFTVYLDFDTKDCLVMGDLQNVTVVNYGINNKVIGITNPHYAKDRILKDSKNIMGTIHEMYNHERDHRWH